MWKKIVRWGQGGGRLKIHQAPKWVSNHQMQFIQKFHSRVETSACKYPRQKIPIASAEVSSTISNLQNYDANWEKLFCNLTRLRRLKIQFKQKSGVLHSSINFFKSAIKYIPDRIWMGCSGTILKVSSIILKLRKFGKSWEKLFYILTASCLSIQLRSFSE